MKVQRDSQEYKGLRAEIQATGYAMIAFMSQWKSFSEPFPYVVRDQCVESHGENGLCRPVLLQFASHPGDIKPGSH